MERVIESSTVTPDIIEFKFHYEEWELALDSHPGWELVPDFVSKLIKMNWAFHGWIYERYREKVPFWDWLFHRKRNRNDQGWKFIDIKRFDSDHNPAFLSLLPEYLTRATVCLIRAPRRSPFEILLRNYSKVSEGFIYNNQKSEVFFYPIEAGDWANLKDDEILMVIKHDGEPVYLLTKSN